MKKSCLWQLALSFCLLTRASAATNDPAKLDLESFRNKDPRSLRHSIGASAPIWVGTRATMRGFNRGAYGTITGNPAADARQDRYYDDGYNRVNSLGNPDLALTGPADSFPRTTFFGFSNNSQFSPAGGPSPGNPGTLSLHSVESIGGAYGDFGSNEIQPGAEIFYRYRAILKEKWSLDFEVGASYLSLDWKQKGNLTGTAGILEDRYNTGTVDPRVDVNAGGILPYNGPFEPAPGAPWIGSTPSRQPTSYQDVLVSGERKLSLESFMVRLGPALDYQLASSLRIGVQVGATLGYARTTMTYSDQFNFQLASLPAQTLSGRVEKDSFVVGLFSSLRLSYDLSEKWDVFAEGRHLWIDKIQLADARRSAEIQISEGVGFTLGFSRHF